MEDKIKELIKDWNVDGGETLYDLAIKIAKVGSLLTAERAKEKIFELPMRAVVIDRIPKAHIYKLEVLQAIEESIIK